MLRRHALFACAGAALAALVAPLAVAEAKDAEAKDKSKGVTVEITEVEPIKGGKTFRIKAKNAPYPVKDGKYDDPSVYVFVPEHYRLSKSKRVDFVVHFHGHNTAAGRSIVGGMLREQMIDSKQNAILMVPQGPMFTADGDFGKLMKAKGLSKLCVEIMKILAKRASTTLGDSSLDGAETVGRVVASAHSGGYRAAAAAAKHGGVDLREVYLFDSLYDEVQTFADFVSKDKDKKHKIVSYAVAGVPKTNGEKLAKILTDKGIDVFEETNDKRVTRKELTKMRGVFLLGKGATHNTATWQEHALKDCLLASCLVGHNTKEWHAEKTKAR